MSGHDHALSSLRIAITGGQGLIGSAIIPHLHAHGAEVISLVRAPLASDGDVSWNPEAPFTPDPRLEDLDAVIHLAGAGIADRRWTPTRRKMLRTSRVDATHHLCDALTQLQRPPKHFIQASAVGIYGDRGEESLDEHSTPGTGFLADLALQWEHASCELEASGTRRVLLRLGMVLSLQGGALARMLPPFRYGIAGRLGDGQQWMSWITLEDATRVIARALTDHAISGPVLSVTPHPVRNRTFTHTLAKIVRRPAIFPAPRMALRLALGGMADELLLSSQRCDPKVLQQHGHQYQHPTLEDALAALIHH